VTQRDRLHIKVGVAARGFVLVALLTAVLWSQDTAALLALLAIGVVWTVVTAVEQRPSTASMALVCVECAAVGLIVGVVMDNSLAVLGAMAVPPFTAGLHRSVRGVLVALGAELVALAMVFFLSGDRFTQEEAIGVFSWGMTALGLGLIGAFLRSTLRETQDPLAPYRYAQTLIRQLIDLSGGLSSGLDPVALGGAILSNVDDELPTSALVVHIPRGDILTPLVSKTMSPDDDLSPIEDLAVEAWAVGAAVLDDRMFAFPLTTSAGTTAVVAGLLSERVDLDQLGVQERIRGLIRSLEGTAVHLDTALLFSAFRDSATAEERRRLAREIHDGVAQDIASLGYLVDALRAGENEAKQVERIDLLRDRITSVVAEIRRSVVTLRTSVGSAESLGTAIGSIARNLSEVSGMPIHVTLDEHTARLRAEVEAELFRIAQEAMNNAVRHAHASAIEVHCQVHAPNATITVSDDGRGLQPGGTTSHGLAIMRERALLIGAGLELGETPGGGFTVTVRVPASQSPEVADLGASRAKIGA
jgi:signal transduction histidine kinase